MDVGGRDGGKAIETECEEANREVKGFAGDFVPVDEGAPRAVDGD